MPISKTNAYFFLIFWHKVAETDLLKGIFGISEIYGHLDPLLGFPAKKIGLFGVNFQLFYVRRP